MRLSPGAPDLAASLDGAYVACTDKLLTLYDAQSHAELASAPLDGTADIGFVGSDKLLAVVPGDGRTQLFAYSLPSLELLAQLELEGRLRALAFVGQRGLIATENMEQPRVVTITTKIFVEPIALREPLMLATAAPEERLLVASRTRESQLECWDPMARRALFRLNLPLMPRAELAGFSSRRRLLWIAGTQPGAQLEVFRYSDGRLQARVELGAPVVAAAGHPDSSRLVVATRTREDAEAVLTELDFQAGERKALEPPFSPRAFCVVEGATPALVLIDHGVPVWMPLGAHVMEQPTSDPVAAPAQAQPKAAHPRVSDPNDWRARLHADETAATKTPPKPAAGPTSPMSPMRKTVMNARSAAPPARGVTVAAHWRDELCEWAEQLLARPHGAAPTPELDAASTLVVLVERLALDARAARGLALLYGARLLGDGAVPAATVARALGGGGDGANGGDGDGANSANSANGGEAAWEEALGRGLLGQLGLGRARDGKLALSAAAGRFLDGAPARVQLVAGGASEADLPGGNTRVDGGAEALVAIGRRLAEQFGYDVALVSVDGPRPRRALAARLVEARLHGAWPVVDVHADPVEWLDALDEGPTVVVVRGDVPAALATLPQI